MGLDSLLRVDRTEKDLPRSLQLGPGLVVEKTEKDLPSSQDQIFLAGYVPQSLVLSKLRTYVPRASRPQAAQNAPPYPNFTEDLTGGCGSGVWRRTYVPLKKPYPLNCVVHTLLKKSGTVRYSASFYSVATVGPIQTKISGKWARGLPAV